MPALAMGQDKSLTDHFPGAEDYIADQFYVNLDFSYFNGTSDSISGASDNPFDSVMFLAGPIQYKSQVVEILLWTEGDSSANHEVQLFTSKDNIYGDMTADTLSKWTTLSDTAGGVVKLTLPTSKAYVDSMGFIHLRSRMTVTAGTFDTVTIGQAAATRKVTGLRGTVKLKNKDRE